MDVIEGRANHTMDAWGSHSVFLWALLHSHFCCLSVPDALRFFFFSVCVLLLLVIDSIVRGYTSGLPLCRFKVQGNMLDIQGCNIKMTTRGSNPCVGKNPPPPKKKNRNIQAMEMRLWKSPLARAPISEWTLPADPKLKSLGLFLKHLLQRWHKIRGGPLQRKVRVGILRKRQFRRKGTMLLPAVNSGENPTVSSLGKQDCKRQFLCKVLNTLHSMKEVKSSCFLEIPELSTKLI